MQQVCKMADLPENSAREFELNGQGVILVNWFGQLYAWLNDCPHAGWPLNFQPDQFFDADGRFLQCSNHMALFEPDTGTCVAGPCTGDCLQAVKIQIEGDDVFAQPPGQGNPES